jgi:sensor domain CHASE-containing protein
MDPSNLIMWAVCLGVAWLVFASITGADDWLKSLIGKSKRQDLEDKVAKLEKRLDDLSPSSSADEANSLFSRPRGSILLGI